jgi:hypothetical protein
MAPSKWEGEQVRPSSSHGEGGVVPGPSRGCAMRAGLTADTHPHDGPLDRPRLVVGQAGGAVVVYGAAPLVPSAPVKCSSWTRTVTLKPALVEVTAAGVADR